MKELVEYIAKSLVNAPDAVVVTEEIDAENGILLKLKVADEDKGRIIGKEGTVKKEIERMVDCYIAVYGNTVGIIAPPDSLAYAQEAISMLIKGAMHTSVLSFLSKKREELTLSRLIGEKAIR